MLRQTGTLRPATPIPTMALRLQEASVEGPFQNTQNRWHACRRRNLRVLQQQPLLLAERVRKLATAPTAGTCSCTARGSFNTDGRGSLFLQNLLASLLRIKQVVAGGGSEQPRNVKLNSSSLAGRQAGLNDGRGTAWCLSEVTDCVRSYVRWFINTHLCPAARGRTIRRRFNCASEVTICRKNHARLQGGCETGDAVARRTGQW